MRYGSCPMMGPAVLLAAMASAQTGPAVLLAAMTAAQTPAVVIFKRARTGSTWMADMLAQEAQVAFFRHEAHSCFPGDAARTKLAYEIMVRRPTCATPMCAPKGNADWLAAPTTTDCLTGKLVGFDVKPSHAPALSWDHDWPRILAKPVKTVVYVRTNTIKHAVSALHAEILVQACDTHKALSDAAKKCAAENKEALGKKISVDARSLSVSARKTGRAWVDLLENATKASGGPVFLMYYEALQRDARAELGRLFEFVGLRPPALPSSSSVKITPDDLRETLNDFAQVQDDLARLDPALLPQLQDTTFTIFRELYIPDNTSTSFKRYEVPPPRSHFIVVTTQRSGSGWLLDELKKPDCLDSGRELFDTNPKHNFSWSSRSARAAVDGFLRMAPGGANTFSMDVGDKFHAVAHKWGKQQPDPKRRYGFKWMLNQPTHDLFNDAFQGWLFPLLRERRGKLVFLVRQHLLRQMVSIEANKADAERADHKAHAHSNEEARDHSQPVALPVGTRLMRHLDFELARIAKMERLAALAAAAGVGVRTVSYEDLNADRAQFDALRRWLASDDPCADAFAAKPDTQMKIHGDGHWQRYVSNWGEVAESLQGTRYAVYLDEAYVPRGGDAWEQLRDAPRGSTLTRAKKRNTTQPLTKAARPGRIYPKDRPGCLTAGRDHHCRMKSTGNVTLVSGASTKALKEEISRRADFAKRFPVKVKVPRAESKPRPARAHKPASFASRFSPFSSAHHTPSATPRPAPRPQTSWLGRWLPDGSPGG